MKSYEKSKVTKEIIKLGFEKMFWGQWIIFEMG